MTNSRTRWIRITVPAAAALLALAACSSSTSESAEGDEMMASPSAEMMESEAMVADEMPADEMAADEMAEDEMMASEEGHSGDAGSDEMDSDGDAMADDAMMPEQSGAFVDYAAYEADKAMYDAGTVVLFFNASWCPTCQEAVGNLDGDPDAIPSGLTVVSIDYDSSDDLKRTYGVTTQHTFVQVDADGNELAKWTGSVTAAEIAKKTV